jgi:four helix bundle protein
MPADIAEGHARHTTRGFVRFLHIARGILAELGTEPAIDANLGRGSADDQAPAGAPAP